MTNELPTQEVLTECIDLAYAAVEASKVGAIMIAQPDGNNIVTFLGKDVFMCTLNNVLQHVVSPQPIVKHVNDEGDEWKQ